MKAVCSFCGRANRAEAAVCSQCGGSLAEARLERFRLPWCAWLPGMIVAIVLSAKAYSVAETRANLQRGWERERAQMERAIAEARAVAETDFRASQEKLEAQHRERLSDTNYITGRAAAQNHKLEWQRRENHDPEFAQTWLEKSLIEAEKLGRNSEVAAERALQQVAEMVSPAGSRIEVTPAGERFVVRVAFRLSAVLPDEAGSGTRHTNAMTMRKEIEEITAHVVKALFDFCGSRGIQSLSVSCNRALAEGADADQRLVMRSLYRVTVNAERAAAVSNWRSITLPQISKICKVERDRISTITIAEGGATHLRLDPDQPLEF